MPTVRHEAVVKELTDNGYRKDGFARAVMAMYIKNGDFNEKCEDELNEDFDGMSNYQIFRSYHFSPVFRPDAFRMMDDDGVTRCRIVEVKDQYGIEKRASHFLGMFWELDSYDYHLPFLFDLVSIDAYTRSITQYAYGLMAPVRNVCGLRGVADACTDLRFVSPAVYS